MRRTALFIVVSAMALTLDSCDWFRARLGMPTSAELLEIKEKAHQDSILHAQLLWQREQQRRIQDSVARAEAQKQQEMPRYHVVFGSFMVPENAKRMVERLTGNGYKPVELHFRNGFSVVSAVSCNNLQEAYAAMNRLVESVPFAPYDIWIYDLKQNLHK